jgi:hypothetical protein
MMVEYWKSNASQPDWEKVTLEFARIVEVARCFMLHGLLCFQDTIAASDFRDKCFHDRLHYLPMPHLHTSSRSCAVCLRLSSFQCHV